MEFLDEKIIKLMNEMQEKNNPISEQKEVSQDEYEQAEIDIHQSFISINGEEIQIIEQTLFEGKVKIRMPKLFQLMLPELASLKYPSERRPAIIYTDDSTTINLAFNHTQNLLNDTGITEFQESMVEILQQTQPSAEWLEQGDRVINDKNIGFIEVITPALDGDIFNLMFFVSLDGKALIGTFNCMEEDMDDWRPVAKAMMETLQVYPKEIDGGASR
ncbi:hypothetical protein [Sporosarcina limicola]|uniref:DUF1795 domain-containing protein n=1 Tax=Sporosarcina limicola TaxID=34101 RepID=A0A927R7F8_9BACL|nr:hypothetical protein [Sporosarcina limicola]MBE1555944.1 hypothetical protein [Sporosarcina limicola]